MGNRKKRKARELQLAFDFAGFKATIDDAAFASRVDGVLDAFRREAVRKGPRAVGRAMGIAHVAPHWRRIGGAR